MPTSNGKFFLVIIHNTFCIVVSRLSTCVFRKLTVKRVWRQCKLFNYQFTNLINFCVVSLKFLKGLLSYWFKFLKMLSICSWLIFNLLMLFVIWLHFGKFFFEGMIRKNYILVMVLNSQEVVNCVNFKLEHYWSNQQEAPKTEIIYLKMVSFSQSLP